MKCFDRSGDKAPLLKRNDFTIYFPTLTPTHFYMEPFCGTLEVATRIRSEPNTKYYLNDLDGDLINFWRVLAKRQAELEEALKYVWLGMEWEPNPDDPIDRAVQFYIRSQKKTRNDIIYHTIVKDFEPWRKWLDEHLVMFHCKDAIDFMKIYATNHHSWNLIYLDPPYHNTGAYHYSDVPFDHKKLASYLRSIRDSHVIFLSHSDDPFMRDLYADWNMLDLGTVQQVHGERREILITNQKIKGFKPVLQRTCKNCDCLSQNTLRWGRYKNVCTNESSRYYRRKVNLDGGCPSFTNLIF